MRRKLLAFLLVVVMLSGIGTLSAFAEGEGALVTVKSGDVVAVPITLDNCNRLKMLVATVEYDTDLLSLEVMGGKEGLGFTWTTNGFGIQMPTGQALNGKVTIGYMVFTVKEGLTEPVTTYVTFPSEGRIALNDTYQPAPVDIPTVGVKITTGQQEQDILYGDLNEDGTVDLADTIVLMQYLSGNTTLSSQQLKAADVNRDGVVNVGDVITLMQMCLILD